MSLWPREVEVVIPIWVFVISRHSRMMASSTSFVSVKQSKPLLSSGAIRRGLHHLSFSGWELPLAILLLGTTWEKSPPLYFPQFALQRAICDPFDSYGALKAKLLLLFAHLVLLSLFVCRGKYDLAVPLVLFFGKNSQLHSHSTYIQYYPLSFGDFHCGSFRKDNTASYCLGCCIPLRLLFFI